MRAFRIVLALLTTLGSYSAFSAPSKLVDAPQGGNLPYDFYVAMCTASGPPNCGPVTYRPKAVAWYCTDAYFTKPAAAGPYSCWIDSAPAVPANPLPVWGLPVTAKPFQACIPEFKVKWPSGEIEGLTYVAVPSVLESSYDRFYKWTDCTTKKVTGQFSNPAARAQLAAAYAAGLLGSSDAVNQWVRAQSVEALTAKEEAWRTQELAASNAPVQLCQIAAQSATVQDRAVYKTVSATGTASGSISGVRSPAGTVVPCASKIGNYFSVAGTKDTQGRVIAAGYAIGAQQ